MGDIGGLGLSLSPPGKRQAVGKHGLTALLPQKQGQRPPVGGAVRGERCPSGSGRCR